MQLKEFITESLNQIFIGISDAKTSAALHGFQVNPWITTGKSDMAGVLVDRETKPPLQIVDFDVAVTTEESKQSKGGAGIMIAAITFGGHAQSDTKNSVVSRIRFSVPISFPRASD